MRTPKKLSIPKKLRVAGLAGDGIDDVLIADICKNGPILLWTGEVFPAQGQFRGLNLDRIRLTEWIRKCK